MILSCHPATSQHEERIRHAAPFSRRGRPNHNRHIRRGRRKASRRLHAGLHKPLLLKQVLGRIAADAELRQHHKVRTSIAGRNDPCKRDRRVPGDVANGRIHRAKCKPDGHEGRVGSRDVVMEQSADAVVAEGFGSAAYGSTSIASP